MIYIKVHEMSKNIFLVLFIIIVSYITSHILYKDLFLSLQNINAQIENINAFNRVIKDNLAIKDKDIEEKKDIIKKQLANYEAFNGTDCARCHLDSKYMLPMNDKYLTLQEYIQIIRTGSNNMPSYENRPSKGLRDLTDSEARRQYKILSSLYENINIAKDIR